MAGLFGWSLTRNNRGNSNTALVPVDDDQQLPSFVPKQDDDGAVIISGSGVYGQYVDINGVIQNDSELITRYRQMADHPALDMAITTVVNESIINEPEDDTVSIDLSDVDAIPDGTKDKIEDEFHNLLNIFNFNLNGYEMFRRWYIDGRLFYHVIIDPKNVSDGIQELRYIDPRKIRLVREVKKTQPLYGSAPANNELSAVQTVNEFYVFNEAGFTRQNLSAAQNAPGDKNTIKISKDAIVQCSSGLVDVDGKSVVGYLHKAIRPLNQLTMQEDAMIIYRLSRAPERRVFYVDTAGMSSAKAEQYMRTLMTNFKNKVVYDSQTGTVRDDRKFASMTEDFWLQRREGGKGTEIDTLPAGQNLGEITDIQYMRERLYQALNIPLSRLDQDSTYSLGRATEISRDEVSFEKFITRTRSRFSVLFLNALRVQLLLKRIISPDDWTAIKNKIKFIYAKDNLFAELKDSEMMQNRLAVATAMMPFVGHYFSNEQIRTEVLKQTDEQMKLIDKQIKKEANNAQYQFQDPNADPDMSGDLTSLEGQAQPPMQLPAPAQSAANS